MKLPAFQFYPGDWLKDPQLAMASPAVRGIWIDFIAVSFEAPVRGVLEGTAVEFGRLLRCSTDEFMEFVNEAQRLGFADVTPTSSVTVTQMSRVVFRVECRRMTRDEKQRQDWGLRKRRERERKAGHADVTSMSQLSSSSSSSSSKKEKDTSLADARFGEFWQVYPKKVDKQDALDQWRRIDPALFDSIIADASQRWVSYSKDDKEFIPGPAKYLRKKKWTDEVVPHTNGRQPKPLRDDGPTMAEVRSRE